MTDPKSSTDTSTLSREESAFFIKTLWEGLLAPAWTRDDLIELGKVIFAKIPLARLTDQQFTQLLPYLKVMAETVGKKTLEKVAAAQAAKPESKKPEGEAPNG